MNKTLIKEIIAVMQEGQEVISGFTKYILIYDCKIVTLENWETYAFPDGGFNKSIGIRSNVFFSCVDELVDDIESIFITNNLDYTKEDLEYIKNNYTVDNCGYVKNK